jgi:dynein light chain LC8-type
MDIAGFIKKECDRIFKPSWQVLIGRNYACFISHVDQNFLYMHQHGLSFVIYKTTP